MARIITATGEMLRKWRQEQNLSQYQVTKLPGDLDQVTINQLENGKRRVSVALALKLEKATSIQARDWLIAQMDEEIDAAREVDKADGEAA